MLVLVPILNFHMSPVLGTAVGTLVMLLALLYAVAVILKKRTVIRDRLLDKAEATSGPGRVALGVSARLWHLAALAYALMVFAVTVINPETALPFVAMATLETLIYVGVGLLVSVVLTQVIGKEIQLSDRLNEKLPRLQARVNTYVPTGLKVIRALILALVVILSLDAWEVYDLAAWYATAAGAHTVAVVLHILVILAVAAAVWIGIASLLEHKLTPAEGADPATVARANTLMGLFHTTLAIAIIIMTLMIVLAEIGINIGPLIAGAGVLGLAIGFGAQKLVQDVITGVFIQLENAMNTGDFVTAGSHSGTVERVGIRSVALRDLYGTYHIVPFSSVDAVSNFTREYGNHVGEYGIGYRESIDDAIVQLEAAFEELKEGPHKDNILAPMTVAGVTALADSSVNIRVVIKTTPGNQWAVGRAYNRLVKIYFDKAGIEIPFPHTTLYFGEDRDGNAPPANVRMLNDERVVDTQQDGTSSDRSE
jgi:small conductance mechanosensitive channel